jgi:hypothetical protein
MYNKRSSIAIFGALAVIIVAFNIIAFVVADELTTQFWSGYVFITLSWLCLIALSVKIMQRKEFIAYNLFLAMPQILIALTYFLFQLVTGISVMAIPDFSLTASIVIQVLLLAVFFIAEFGISAYKGVATQMPEKRQAEISFKSNMILDIENAINRCKNPILKQKLTETNELLKYSDPVSSDETASFEGRILELFSQVKSNTYQEEHTPEIIISVCDEIMQLMKQRNAVCAAAKKH